MAADRECPCLRPVSAEVRVSTNYFASRVSSSTVLGIFEDLSCSILFEESLFFFFSFIELIRLVRIVRKYLDNSRLACSVETLTTANGTRAMCPIQNRFLRLDRDDFVLRAKTDIGA